MEKPYLEEVVYDFMEHQYIGEFEDGMNIIVSVDDIPNGMDVFDFINEIRKGLEEDILGEDYGC